MKKSAFNVAGNLVMGVKFTFQSVFGNSLQNPRHFSARGREESLELYSILWSDWPTSKQEVLRHGNRFVARVRRRYFSEGEKRRPEMRLRFAGYSWRRGQPNFNFRLGWVLPAKFRAENIKRLPFRLMWSVSGTVESYVYAATII